jgi:hypothetical protein
LRTQALAKPEVGDFLTKNFVATFEKVGTFSVTVAGDGLRENKNGGNVAAFLCTPAGRVIHAVAGPRTGEAFLAEAKWATSVYAQILRDPAAGSSQASKAGGSRIAAALRLAHASAHQTLTVPGTPPAHEWVSPPRSSDPKLAGLDAQGRQQRQQVHRVLQTKAFEPLAVVGPDVYSRILGEHVTGEPVRLQGATDAQKAAGTGKRLGEFFADGGSSSDGDRKPLAPTPPPKSQSKAKR